MSVSRIADLPMTAAAEQIITDITPSIISYELTLSALAPGTYEIGPLALTASPLEIDSDELKSVIGPLTITVESIHDGESELADIKDPFAPPPDYTKIALITAGSGDRARLADRRCGNNRPSPTRDRRRTTQARARASVL